VEHNLGGLGGGLLGEWGELGRSCGELGMILVAGYSYARWGRELGMRAGDESWGELVGWVDN
jgi:hypothetical protein